MELQDYLINRTKELSYKDLTDLKDDYISYYKATIDTLLQKFVYHLSQFVFFQEEFKYKSTVKNYEIFVCMIDMIRSEIKVFANSPDIYLYLRIDELIDEAFEAGDCSCLTNGKYKEEYWNCKKLLKENLSIEEYNSIMNSICRTDIAKDWNKRGELE